MKCEVCGAQIREGSTECARCAYPIIVSVGSDRTQLEEERSALAEQYSSQLLGGAEIGFVAYSHKISKDSRGNEKLELDYETEVPFGQVKDLGIGDLVWNQEGFLRPRTSSLETTIYIRQGGRMKRRKIRFPVSRGSGDCYIGVKRMYPVTVRVCLKDGSVCRESEDICVV